MQEYKIRTQLGSVGNTEFWTEKDWEEQRALIERLKQEGRLGEVVEHTVFVEENELFDNNQTEEPVMSCRMIIFDLSKTEKDGK